MGSTVERGTANRSGKFERHKGQSQVSILPQGMEHFLGELGKRVLSPLLPASCLLCGSDSGRAPVCPACVADLPSLPEQRCPQCAEATTHGERCGHCLAHGRAFDAAQVLYRYDFPLDRLVHALKYGHQLSLAAWFGARLAASEELPPCDRVVPLPLHPKRLQQRGFNQSTEIARVLCRQRRLALDIGSLRRCRETRPQADLPLKDRPGNMRGAFACANDLSGQRILLVDDVMTSCATLHEAARVLKLHGASEVIVAVVARALRHP